MKNKTNELLVIISGTLFSLSCYFNNFLYDQLWIFFLFPILLFGASFLTLLLNSFLKKYKSSQKVGLLLLIPIATVFIIESELFKSEILLEALLIDDLSAINLTLRENDEYCINYSTIFSEDYNYGNYKLINNQIILNNLPIGNSFIPDTIFILDDKIILKFNEDGSPNTSYASFFTIKKNKIEMGL